MSLLLLLLLRSRGMTLWVPKERKDEHTLVRNQVVSALVYLALAGILLKTLQAFSDELRGHLGFIEGLELRVSS